MMNYFQIKNFDSFIKSNLNQPPANFNISSRYGNRGSQTPNFRLPTPDFRLPTFFYFNVFRYSTIFAISASESCPW